MSHPLLILSLLGLLACSDYNLEGKEQGNDDADGSNPDSADPGTPGDSADPDTGTPTPEEECNGIDDDGDGEIDEDMPDIDEDGVPDCLDECELEAGPGSSIAQDPRCLAGYSPPADLGDLVEEWRWTGLSTNPDADSVLSPPVVGQLTDDNGDGLIDDRDNPDVAFTACEWAPGSIPTCTPVGAAVHYMGSLVIVDGATGVPHQEIPGFNVLGHLALGDVDADGVPEVLGFDQSGHVIGVRADGILSFRSATPASLSPWYSCINIADLDADGTPEVITDIAVWGGGSGALEAAVLSSGAPNNQVRSCPAGDFDQDGVQEWITGPQVTSPAGAREAMLAASFGNINTDSQWTIPLQFDADLEAEFGLVAHGRWQLFDTNGSVLHDEVIETDTDLTAGPPCMGDFDGDGASEVAIPWGLELHLIELDGSTAWTAPISDTSGAAGCSGFDIDNDGALEILYADEDTAYVLDGTTGAEVWRSEDHRSGTGSEYPVVADLDRDGSAEVLFVSNEDAGTGTWEGIVAIGHATDGWAPSGTAWNVHDFALTGVEQGGRIPTSPESPWIDLGIYRARPGSDGGPELSIAFTASCVASCDIESVMQVAVQVSNRGHAPATVPVTLYRDNGGTLTPIDVKTATVQPGEATAEIVFDLVRAVLGTDGLVARVDDDGTGASSIEECDESDNEARWNEDPCP